MLDPGYVRDHIDEVAARLATRGGDFSRDLAALKAKDAERLQLLQTVENLKREQNSAGEQVAKAKKEGRDATAILAENKARAAKIKELDAELTAVDAARDAMLLTVPNLPHASVPVGKSAADNAEVRTWGTVREFDFAPKPHWEIGEGLGILDFERATRMAGARFAVLIGAGAKPRARRMSRDFPPMMRTTESSMRLAISRSWISA